MMDRGQSTLDFLLGTVVFLLAVTLVVAVVPGMLDPFVTGTESHPVLADRAADTLVTEEFGDPESPYSTTEARVSSVFSRSPETLATDLGLSDRTGFNATVVNGTGSVRGIGDPPPESASVTAARRVVGLEDGLANVTVRVW